MKPNTQQDNTVSTMIVWFFVLLVVITILVVVLPGLSFIPGIDTLIDTLLGL